MQKRPGSSAFLVMWRLEKSFLFNFPCILACSDRDRFESDCVRRHGIKWEFPLCSPTKSHFVRETCLRGYMGLHGATRTDGYKLVATKAALFRFDSCHLASSPVHRVGRQAGPNAHMPREYRQWLSLRCGHSVRGPRLSLSNLRHGLKIILIFG